MGVTRTYSPINVKCPAWFKMNDEWHRVLVIACITEKGVVKNEIRFEDGRGMEVVNDLLRFGERKPRR